jgi:hypothetical protein
MKISDDASLRYGTDQAEPQVEKIRKFIERVIVVPNQKES